MVARNNNSLLLTIKAMYDGCVIVLNMPNRRLSVISADSLLNASIYQMDNDMVRVKVNWAPSNIELQSMAKFFKRTCGFKHMIIRTPIRDHLFTFSKIDGLD